MPKKRRCSVDSLRGKSRCERRNGEEKGRTTEEEAHLVAVAAAAAAEMEEEEGEGEEANNVEVGDRPWRPRDRFIGAALCRAATLKVFFQSKEDVKIEAGTAFEASRPLAAALAAARNMEKKDERKVIS